MTMYKAAPAAYHGCSKGAAGNAAPHKKKDCSSRAQGADRFDPALGRKKEVTL